MRTTPRYFKDRTEKSILNIGAIIKLHLFHFFDPEVTQELQSIKIICLLQKRATVLKNERDLNLRAD